MHSITITNINRIYFLKTKFYLNSSERQIVALKYNGFFDEIKTTRHMKQMNYLFMLLSHPMQYLPDGKSCKFNPLTNLSPKKMYAAVEAAIAP